MENLVKSGSKIGNKEVVANTTFTGQFVDFITLSKEDGISFDLTVRGGTKANGEAASPSVRFSTAEEPTKPLYLNMTKNLQADVISLGLKKLNTKDHQVLVILKEVEAGEDELIYIAAKKGEPINLTLLK